MWLSDLQALAPQARSPFTPLAATMPFTSYSQESIAVGRNELISNLSEILRAQSLSRVDSLWPHGGCQALLSMGFPRQECQSGWSFPPPGALPNPGIKPSSPALQAHSLLLSHIVKYLWMGIYLNRFSSVQARSVFPSSLLLNSFTCHCSSELMYHAFLCWIFSYGDSNFSSSASGQASGTIQCVKY